MRNKFDQLLAAWAAKHKELARLEECLAAQRKAGREAVWLEKQVAGLKKESDAMLDDAMRCLSKPVARKVLALPGGAGLRD